MKIFCQELNGVFSSEIDIARKFYSILFSINGIEVTPKELALLSFSSVRGSLSSPPIRDAFIEGFGVSKGTVYNMLSSLQKRKLMVKVEGKVRINPSIQIDFFQE